MDRSELKVKQHQSWTSVAPGWAKYDQLLSNYAAPVTERMLELAAIGPGSQLLDIASGAGEPSVTAAEKVGPTGKVLGTDFVEEMLLFARKKATERGLRNIEFRKVDGEGLDVGRGQFDAATVRWGLMFMPDPLACLKGIHAALRPEGRVVVACWADPARNPFVTVPLAVLRKHVNFPDSPPGTPGMFALADSTRLLGLLKEAGFREVSIEQMTVPMADFATGAQYDECIRSLAGPVATLFSQLSGGEQAVVQKEIAEEGLRQSSVPGRVVLEGFTHLALGLK